MELMIPVALSDNFNKQLGKINKKLKKFNNELSAIPGRVKRIETADGSILARQYFVDFAEEKDNVFGGWKFAGTKKEIPIIKDDKVEKVVILNSWVDPKTIPQMFFDSGICCHHCNVNRYRKNSTILFSEEYNSFIEIGNSCLEAFTSSLNLNKVVEILSDLEDIKKNYDDTISDIVQQGCRIDWRVYDPKDVLALAIVIDDRQGFYGRNYGGMANSTRMIEVLDPFNDEERNKTLAQRISASENQLLRMEEIYNFYTSYQGEDNILNTGRQFMESDAVDYKAIPYIAYLPKAYADFKAREKEYSKPSEYIGEIGTRIKALPVTVDFVRAAYSDWYQKHYQIIKFRDLKGNIIVWFNYGERLKNNIGDTITIAATPTKHQVDNYTKQYTTTVNRVKIL